MAEAIQYYKIPLDKNCQSDDKDFIFCKNVFGCKIDEHKPTENDKLYKVIQEFYRLYHAQLKKYTYEMRIVGRIIQVANNLNYHSDQEVKIEPNQDAAVDFVISDREPWDISNTLDKLNLKKTDAVCEVKLSKWRSVERFKNDIKKLKNAETNAKKYFIYIKVETEKPEIYVFELV